MMRLNLMLLAAVLASAFYLINLQYQSRTLYNASDKAQAEGRKLATERDTLEVVKRAQTASLRVESMARTQLGMREAAPGITQYVTLHDGKVSVSTSAAATIDGQPAGTRVARPATAPVARAASAARKPRPARRQP